MILSLKSLFIIWYAFLSQNVIGENLYKDTFFYVFTEKMSVKKCSNTENKKTCFDTSKQVFNAIKKNVY